MLLGTVIGYEVPDKRVSRARPKTVALASIVSRLEPKQPIAHSCQGVLCNELSVARTDALGKAPETITPFRRSVRGLIG